MDIRNRQALVIFARLCDMNFMCCYVRSSHHWQIPKAKIFKKARVILIHVQTPFEGHTHLITFHSWPSKDWCSPHNAKRTQSLPKVPIVPILLKSLISLQAEVVHTLNPSQVHRTNSWTAWKKPVSEKKCNNNNSNKSGISKSLRVKANS